MLASVSLQSERFEKLLREFPDRADKAMKISLQQAAEFVQNDAKQNAPYLTGNLRRSITSRLKGYTAEVGTDVVYARIQELGGVILPKTKKYLRFKTSSGWVTVGKVVIPPYKGQGYLRPALKDNSQKILQTFADNIEKQLSK